MNSPVLGPATVKLSGGLYRSGEGFEMAKLTFLGNSPNATVKLFRWESVNNRDVFTEHDMLRKATVSEGRDGDNKLSITGISQMALEEGRGTFTEADCMATWDIVLTGHCAECS